MECKETEAWRAECEARAVARMPKDERTAYYALVLKHRGPDALAALKAAAVAEWRKANEPSLF